MAADRMSRPGRVLFKGALCGRGKDQSFGALQRSPIVLAESRIHPDAARERRSSVGFALADQPRHFGHPQHQRRNGQGARREHLAQGRLRESDADRVVGGRQLEKVVAVNATLRQQDPQWPVGAESWMTELFKTDEGRLMIGGIVEECDGYVAIDYHGAEPASFAGKPPRQCRLWRWIESASDSPAKAAIGDEPDDQQVLIARAMRATWCLHSIVIARHLGVSREAVDALFKKPSPQLDAGYLRKVCEEWLESRGLDASALFRGNLR